MTTSPGCPLQPLSDRQPAGHSLDQHVFGIPSRSPSAEIEASAQRSWQFENWHEFPGVYPARVTNLSSPVGR
jgi:hypothetical protein